MGKRARRQTAGVCTTSSVAVDGLTGFDAVADGAIGRLCE
jgi:hypothetical protein